MKPWILAGLLLMSAMAGCLTTGDQGTTFDADAPDANGGNATAAPQATDADANQTEAPNAPPAASLEASSVNGTAPLNVTFYVNASDPDDDQLTWTLDADGDDVADAEGVDATATVDVTYDSNGTYIAVLTVDDGEAQTSANLTITVLAPAPAAVTAEDAAGDAETDYSDLLAITIELTETHLVAVVEVDTVWPSTTAMSGTVYALNVNGNGFDSFVRYPIDSNPRTWDNGAGAYMADGTTTWDLDADTVTFQIPLEYLADEHGMTAPFEVSARSGLGTFIVDEPDDLLPDEGTITVG